MNKNNWQKIKSVFETASGLSGKERENFLDKECGEDAELRREIEHILDSFDKGDTSILEDPAVNEFVSRILEKETRAMNVTTGKVATIDFIAGTVIDNRYRIIGLLGKGGMGEVYKADDIKLDQTVALKFLPEQLSKNEDALRRFVGEVKTARQVSHENVCRVFDIGEVDGKTYLSMEFVEGDDLSQLLNRIGRLPSDKAVEISRQICLGLSAIHKAGILHRDLKPANIIIDSKGTARITDFGIAGFEADVQGAESKVGTPAYMSPEQITGKNVTQRSDIYSLGLLIYEIFTGKQAINGASLDEIIDIHQSKTPTNPSEFVEKIDPLVERVIMRCLEKDPSKRPATAIQVAAALPGGDPLAAALAAGETPSPEMVAASGDKTGLRPAIAVALFAAIVVGLVIAAFVGNRVSWKSELLRQNSPDDLARTAREIIKRIGYTDPPLDTASGFGRLDPSFQQYIEKNSQPADRWNQFTKSRPGPIYFWHRQSPRYLASLYLFQLWMGFPKRSSGPRCFRHDIDPTGSRRTDDLF